MNFEQLSTFLNFFLTGITIGILFDIFRILRKSFKTLDFITYIQDILFWILTGSILLYSIFTFNNGELRGYIFLAIIFGLVMYILVVSKYFIDISAKILCSIKKVVSYPFKIFLTLIKKYFLLPINKNISKINFKIFKITKKSDKITKKV